MRAICMALVLSFTACGPSSRGGYSGPDTSSAAEWTGSYDARISATLERDGGAQTFTGSETWRVEVNASLITVRRPPDCALTWRVDGSTATAESVGQSCDVPTMGHVQRWTLLDGTLMRSGEQLSGSLRWSVLLDGAAAGNVAESVTATRQQ